ncbi:MAG: hypothetical protein FWF81_00215 [Defluviitaleaceae bacterium]|nr:hypothetical protein [Defluviitaleaceae bacterium]
MIESVIYRIMEGGSRFHLINANLSDWSTNIVVNANISLLILLACCTVGGILLVISILHKGKI